jgi:hypothetical protein
LIVEGQVVEISLVNCSEEEALQEEGNDHSVLEKLDYIRVSTNLDSELQRENTYLVAWAMRLPSIQ